MKTLTLTYKNLHSDIQTIIQNDLIKDSRIDNDSEVFVEENGAFQREPSGEIKQKYTANLLYKQLPSYFGFKPSEIEGFYLLEKKNKKMGNTNIL